MATIGWIGLGRMGIPMSSHLRAAGHTIIGFDPAESAQAAARDAKVTVVDTLSDALSADVVITTLPHTDSVRETYLGSDGILAALGNRSPILVDCSTIAVDVALEIHTAATAQGVRFLDAPVSGGQTGAYAGSLTFMVGGRDIDINDVATVLEPMAGSIVATGGPSTGQATKICNNMILLSNLIAACEGIALARKLGLNEKVFFDATSVSSAASWALKTWYPVPHIVATSPANAGFEATFAADLALHDIELALAAAEQAGLDLPAARYTAGQLAQLVEEGFGQKDASLVIRTIDPELGRI